MHFCNQTLQHVEIRKAPENKDAGDSVRSHHILNCQILEPKSFKPNWPSQLTRTHRAFHPTVVMFLQLVLVDWAKLRNWIKICNLKDGGHGDKDRGIWERRGDIIIIRASSFAHKPKLCPHQQPPPKEKKLPLVCSHTHYACKAFIVRRGCGPEDPSPTDWAGWRVRPWQKRGPSPFFSIWNQSHWLSHSVSPPPPPTTTTHLPPSPAFLPPSSDTGFEPAPQQSPMLNPQPPPPNGMSPTVDTPSLTLRLLLEDSHVMSSQS